MPHQDERSPGTEVQRVSLSTQIADSLRSDIVRGRLPAGTHLLQDELCERFGTSRMPVRDALQQLTHEGLLIEHAGQRVVARLGAEELAEVHSLIAVLHGYAARLVAERATDEELEDLGRRWEAARASDDPEEYARMMWEIHTSINRLANSPRLLKTIQAFLHTVPRTLPMAFPAEMATTKLRYEALMASILSRSASVAEQLVREYSEAIVGLLLRTMQAPDSHDQPR